MNKVIINHELLKKVQAMHEPLTDSDDYEVWKRGLTPQEQIRLTRVADMCEELTDTELAVLSMVAVRTRPQIVLKAILDTLQEGNKDD